jgi:hypothetical protein
MARNAIHLLLANLAVNTATKDRPDKLHPVIQTAPSPTEVACIASVRFARRSYCPSDAVLAAIESAVLGTEVSRGHQIVFVNIGANKGLNINEFMARFHRGWNTSNFDWWKYIGTLAKMRVKDHTPVCGTPKEFTARSASAPRGAAIGEQADAPERRRAYAIAIEMIAATVGLLEGAFSHFGVPGAVVHAAGGKMDGVAGEPRARPGNEMSMVLQRGTNGSIDV